MEMETRLVSISFRNCSRKQVARWRKVGDARVPKNNRQSRHSKWQPNYNLWCNTNRQFHCSHHDSLEILLFETSKKLNQLQTSHLTSKWNKNNIFFEMTVQYFSSFFEAACSAAAPARKEVSPTIRCGMRVSYGVIPRNAIERHHRVSFLVRCHPRYAAQHQGLLLGLNPCLSVHCNDMWPPFGLARLSVNNCHKIAIVWITSRVEPLEYSSFEYSIS